MRVASLLGMTLRVRDSMVEGPLICRPDERAVDALERLLACKVSGAPVVDDAGVVVGVVSWKDLVDRELDVRAVMSSPALTVEADAPIDHAAWLLIESGYHRLIVIDEQRRPLGIVSTLDVVRGLLGVPLRATERQPRPAGDAPGLGWKGLDLTSNHPPSAAELSSIPPVPGVVSLCRGGAGAQDRVAWVEATNDLRARISSLHREPERALPQLAAELRGGQLRVRFVTTVDVERQTRALRDVLYAARERRRAAQRGQTERSDVEG